MAVESHCKVQCDSHRYSVICASPNQPVREALSVATCPVSESLYSTRGGYRIVIRHNPYRANDRTYHIEAARYIYFFTK